MRRRHIMDVPELEAVKVTGPFRLWLRFSDGVVGEVDLSADLRGPVFTGLRDPGVFGQAYLDPELGTVAWPNGADIAPETLYERVRKHPSYA
jgi:hypothetical protein